MSLSRLLALMLSLGLLSLGTPGCGSPVDDDDDDDSVSDDDDDDDDDDAVDDDDTSPPTYSIIARVLDEAGNPLEGIGVTGCSAGTCLLGNTDANGDLSIDNLPGDDGYVVHNISYPGGSQEAVLEYSSFYDIIQLGDQDVTLEAPLVLPQITDTGDPGTGPSGSLTLGDVSVSWSQPIEWPPTAAGLDNPTLGSVEIPSDRWPSAIGEVEGLAAWSFAPFETALEDDDPDDKDEHPYSFTVTVPLEDALVTDTVTFMYADYAADTISEEFHSVEATLEDIDGTIYATVDVPILSFLIAVR